LRQLGQAWMVHLVDELFALSVTCYSNVTPTKFGRKQIVLCTEREPLVCGQSVFANKIQKYEKMRMNPIRKKIDTRLDNLEAALKSGKHLKDGDEFLDVLTLIESIAKFWSILTDAERDFINASRYAVEEQKEWQ